MIEDQNPVLSFGLDPATVNERYSKPIYRSLYTCFDRKVIQVKRLDNPCIDTFVGQSNKISSIFYWSIICI